MQMILVLLLENKEDLKEMLNTMEQVLESMEQENNGMK